MRKKRNFPTFTIMSKPKTLIVLSFHRPPSPSTFALKTTILCPTIQTTHSPCEPFRGLGLRRRSRLRRARCSRKNTRWRRCGSTTGCSMCLGARTTKCRLISLTSWRATRRSPLARCSMPKCAMGGGSFTRFRGTS